MQVRVWDYSGQTNLTILNERNKIAKESQRQSDQEVNDCHLVWLL